MRMFEKVERSREHACAALDAYIAAHDPGQAADVEPTCIGDLIVDLLHLADDIAGGVVRRTADRQQDAYAMTATAYEHFEYESDPANAGEEV